MFLTVKVQEIVFPKVICDYVF